MKPLLEILEAQRRARHQEVGDVAQYREEAAVLLLVDHRQLLAVVGLEQERTHVTHGNVAVLERQRRIDHRTGDHVARTGEEVLVMGVRPAERDDSGDRIAAAPGAAGTLLVVRPSRRHVAQSNRGQLADVDADLHRRGAGEHVDGHARPAAVLRGQLHVLEQQLVDLGLREHSLAAGGVQLRGVLGGDHRHRHIGFGPERGLNRPAVVALALGEDQIRVRIHGLYRFVPAVEAKLEASDGTVHRLAVRAANPFAAELEADVVADQAVFIVGERLAEGLQQDRQPLLLELFPCGGGLQPGVELAERA